MGGLEEGGPGGRGNNLPAGGGLAGTATAALPRGSHSKPGHLAGAASRTPLSRVPGPRCSLPRNGNQRLQMAPRTTCSQEPVRWILAGGQLSLRTRPGKGPWRLPVTAHRAAQLTGAPPPHPTPPPHPVPARGAFWNEESVAEEEAAGGCSGPTQTPPERDPGLALPSRPWLSAAGEGAGSWPSRGGDTGGGRARWLKPISGLPAATPSPDSAAGVPDAPRPGLGKGFTGPRGSRQRDAPSPVFRQHLPGQVPGGGALPQRRPLSLSWLDALPPLTPRRICKGREGPSAPDGQREGSAVSDKSSLRTLGSLGSAGGEGAWDPTLKPSVYHGWRQLPLPATPPVSPGPKLTCVHVCV